MNLQELKNALTEALGRPATKSAYDYLSEFEQHGGKQLDAYELLQELRTSSTYDEDLILDLMDVVSGWCRSNRCIWKHSLGN